MTTLARRLAEGDSEVLGDILRVLGGRTERVLRLKLPGLLTKADYDDVLSVALFRVWQRRGQFDARRASLERWFYVIARNAAIDVLRARSTRPEVTLGDKADTLAASSRSTDDAGSQLTERESARRRQLENALQSLPEVDRRILLSGRTESELSKELRLSPGAIRVRRSRGKRKLRKLLKDDGAT
jgi:RNA polymerase sigma-70 factor (ECF subfamily)